MIMTELIDKLEAIVEFMGKDITDEEAERIGDMARQLGACDLYTLQDMASGTLYTILRMISAEKGWM